VYLAYRDELPQVVHYLPNVQCINVLKREVKDKTVSLHNEWVGKGEIPKVAQGIIKPEMLRWDDFAEWKDEKWLVEWNIKIRVFTDNIRCQGTNRFVEEGPSLTRVHLTGNLELSLKDIPGVPRILAGSITPQIEKFVIGLIKPNLEQVNDAIGKYLDGKR
jgi:hypothetical protein